MNSFFIVISLILNFVALFGIIIIYLRQNRLFELEKKQDRVVKEMEEVISSYLLEIKEDNEEFLEKIKVMYQANISNNNFHFENKEENAPSSPTILNFKQSTETKNGLPNKPIQAARSHVVEAYKRVHQLEDKEDRVKQVDNSDEITSENKSSLQEIISLQEQGFTEEEIAKKLNKGKTEIQLLLKFRQEQ